jgi:uncharacterized protein YqgC (DUF456 family)
MKQQIHDFLKKLRESKSPWKKVIGIICFILGFIALITPLTPGSWLIFVGLELLGFRLAIWEKIKDKILK